MEMKMKKFLVVAAIAALFCAPGIASAQLTFNMFQNFETYVHSGDINCDTTGNGGDVFKVALSNTAMTASWTQLSSVTEISAGNGYTTGGATMTTASLSQTGGVMTWVGGNATWTASGGSIGPARYFVLYSDTSTNDLLVGWWDYGSSFTVADGQPLTLTLTTLLTITTTHNIYQPDSVIEMSDQFYAAIVPKRKRFLIAA